MTQLLRARRIIVRLLLALAAFTAALQCVRLLLVPAIQHLLEPDDALSSLLRRGAVVVLAVLAYWAYARLIEKRAVVELRPAPRGIVLGAASGAGLILLCMGLLFAGGVYAITEVRGWQYGLVNVAGIILVAALLEEIVFRGILFRILESGWGTLPALWLQSLIFAFVHIANVEDRASSMEVVTTMLSGTLLGAMWTLVFVISRNLWVATANHAAWNFSIVLSGLPLSGLESWREFAPIAGDYRGPVWLTGGVFGPEDSVLTMLAVAGCVLLLYRWAKRRNSLVVGVDGGVGGNPTMPSRNPASIPSQEAAG